MYCAAIAHDPRAITGRQQTSIINLLRRCPTNWSLIQERAKNNKDSFPKDFLAWCSSWLIVLACAYYLLRQSPRVLSSSIKDEFSKKYQIKDDEKSTERSEVTMEELRLLRKRLEVECIERKHRLGNDLARRKQILASDAEGALSVKKRK